MDEVSFCAFCGKVVNKDFYYCPYCGTQHRDIPPIKQVVEESCRKLEKVISRKALQRLEKMESTLSIIEKDLDGFLNEK